MCIPTLGYGSDSPRPNLSQLLGALFPTRPGLGSGFNQNPAASGEPFLNTCPPPHLRGAHAPPAPG